MQDAPPAPVVVYDGGRRAVPLSVTVNLLLQDDRAEKWNMPECNTDLMTFAILVFAVG